MQPASGPARRPTAGVLIFAHVPPPHHGQSHAVELLLRELRNLPAPSTLRVFHVDARLSDEIDEIGRFQPRKVLRLLRYCFQAIALRLRGGSQVFYYIPAAPMRSALYRDWLVMLLCRPWFSRTLFHWEAAGLASWLATEARPWERWLTDRLLRNHTMSVILTESGMEDARRFAARAVRIVANGIDDPCPDFEARVRPQRNARHSELATLASQPARPGAPVLGWFRALFMSLCVPEKGLFDLLDGVAAANQFLASTNSAVRVHLSVAGKFWRPEDRARFDERCAAGALTIQRIGATGTVPAVEYRGFVQGADKTRLLETTDALCFPSYYPAEALPIVLLEAMAYGLPIVLTRWRDLPGLLPDDYPLLVPTHSPRDLGRALVTLSQGSHPPSLRDRFLSRYTARAYAEGLRGAIQWAAGGEWTTGETVNPPP